MVGTMIGRENRQKVALEISPWENIDFNKIMLQP